MLIQLTSYTLFFLKLYLVGLVVVPSAKQVFLREMASAQLSLP